MPMYSAASASWLVARIARPNRVRDTTMSNMIIIATEEASIAMRVAEIVAPATCTAQFCGKISSV